MKQIPVMFHFKNRCPCVLLLVQILAIFLIGVHSICDRSCPGADLNRVQYPFGFSQGCEIRLNCINNTIKISEFSVHNITSDNILVNLPPKCNRSINSLQPFFNRNFALTWTNGLLLQNCSASLDSCVIPPALLETQFKRDEGCERAQCFSKKAKGFMVFGNVSQSGCVYVYSSVAVDEDAVNKSSSVSLEFRALKLEWWLEGGCDCDDNATCRKIISPVNGLDSFRCQCVEGYVGDGFKAGNGCRKGRVVRGKKKVMRWKVMIGVLIGVGSLVLIVIFAYRRKLSSCITRGWSNKKSNKNVEVFLQNYGRLSLHRFEYSDLKKLTNYFKDKLGQGGYGGVFKGKLKDGSFIAVKLLNDSKGKGEDFINEVATIGRTNHINIVSLLGFCSEGSKRALVYEYMPNGSLEKFIYKEISTSATHHPLGEEKIYQIALGIANGLEYLHRGCSTRILHFDIKPHNILLDKDFCPKISDFGLAKLCPTRESVVSMLVPRGTMGYIAPEVYCRNFGGVSPKSDVYSYGMMVLEMVGGRKNIDATVDNTSEIYFPLWIYNHLVKNEHNRLGELKDEFEEASIKKMIIVGLWCIQTHPADRPSMSMVVEMLQKNVDDLQMPPNPSIDLRTSSQEPA